MELINLSENPIEIVNPGSGLPGIAPCKFVCVGIGDGHASGGGGGGITLPPTIPPDKHKGPTYP